MHPLRSSSKHSIVSLLVRRSRVFRFTSFSKKGTFFRTPWLQRLGLLVFPEDKPHFTTASCFSVAHSAWSFLHTSFLLLPSKKKCQGESVTLLPTVSRPSGLPNVCRSPRPRPQLPVRVHSPRPRHVKAAQVVWGSGRGALVLALTGVAYLQSRTGGSISGDNGLKGYKGSQSIPPTLGAVKGVDIASFCVERGRVGSSKTWNVR